MNGNFELILADTSELIAECLRVRREVFTEEMGVPEEIERDGLDVLGRCDHFLAFWDGRPAGALRCVLRGGEAVLQRFCVLREYRGRGIGRAMLAATEELYRGRAEKIALDAKLGAAPFYEKCGYARASGEFIEAGAPHVKMEKAP